MMKIKAMLVLVLLLPTCSLFADDGNQSRKDEIKTLLYTVEEQVIIYNCEMSFIQEVNMGIPGGDNWLVEWYNGKDKNYIIMCYAIQENKVVKDIFMSGNSAPFEVSRFDIMAAIPGKRIRDSTAVIGDYNNDGIDELFMFLLGGSAWGVSILGGYNPEIGSLSYLCSVESTIIDPENGPAPVEFITYKGMQGFKVYCFADRPHVEPPKNIINNWFAWYFYTWDEEAREYVEVGEYIEEEYIEVKEGSTGVPPEPEPVSPVLVPTEPLAPAEPIAPREVIPGSERRPVLLLAVIAGLLVLGIATGVVFLRKKK